MSLFVVSYILCSSCSSSGGFWPDNRYAELDVRGAGSGSTGLLISQEIAGQPNHICQISFRYFMHENSEGCRLSLWQLITPVGPTEELWSIVGGTSDWEWIENIDVPCNFLDSYRVCTFYSYAIYVIFSCQTWLDLKDVKKKYQYAVVQRNPKYLIYKTIITKDTWSCL